jgi:hypothetical protein
MKLIPTRFTCYYDESGTRRDPNTPAVVVAGLVASDQQWSKIVGEWETVLRDEGVARFHMRDFAHSKGEFKGWPEDRRLSFIRQLVATMKKVNKLFGVVVPICDFERANRKYMIEEIMYPPYPLAGWVCAQRVMRWHQKNYPQVPIQHVFEDGAEDKGKLMNRLKEVGVAATHAGKEKHIQFQMADLVAWELHKLVATAASGIDPGRIKYRESFNLLEQKAHDWGLYTQEKLVEHCEQAGIPRRNPRSQ